MNLKNTICGVFSLIMLSVHGQAIALLRDNNQIFEVAELAVIKLVLLAPYSGISLRSFDIPEFENKQPIDLYKVTLEAHKQLRRLHRNFGIAEMPVAQIVEADITEEDVYDLLELLNQGLDVLLEQRGLERPLGPESVIGKSAEINYARLWYLTHILTDMLAPPDTQAILAQLAFVKASLNTIARTRKLKNSKDSKTSFDKKSPRDVMLVAYQNLHLLGRLQRRLQIDPVRPGSVATGPVAIDAIYEVTRSTVAHLHQTRLTLGLPRPAAFIVVDHKPSFSELYRAMRDIHDKLIAMTGSITL